MSSSGTAASAQPAKKVRRAYIHVGAPKTGTTFLQGVLWQNRRSLRDAGLHIVGNGPGDHYRAGHDIREVPYDPADPRPDWKGSWDVLCSLAVASEADAVIISDEHLASLTPEQVERAVKALHPREVHVVYASRNLARLVPSEYQEYVKHRSKLTYAEWTAKVFNRRDRGPGRWFWSVHDPVGVVDRWTTAVPPERFHLMTLPLPGSPRDELWMRFCAVVDIDPMAAIEFDVAKNDSLGMAEAEVLRRVNNVLPEDFPRWHHSGIARDVLAVQILGPRSKSGRPGLPKPLQRKVLQQTEENIQKLSASGCHVVGDLAELEVGDELSAADPQPNTEEVLDAAIDGLAGLLVRMGHMRDDRREAEGRLRRQMRESASMTRTRTRVAARLERTRWGAQALSKYRDYRSRSAGTP